MARALLVSFCGTRYLKYQSIYITGSIPGKSNYSLKKSNRPNRFVEFSSDYFVHYRYSDIIENGCNSSTQNSQHRHADKSEYESHIISQQTALILPKGSAGKVARLAHSSMPNCSKQSSSAQHS